MHLPRTIMISLFRARKAENVFAGNLWKMKSRTLVNDLWNCSTFGLQTASPEVQKHVILFDFEK